MRVFIATLLLCLVRPIFLGILLCLAVQAEAKPSLYSPVTQFSGDRYIAQRIAVQGQPARHVARGRAHKARYHYRTRKARPAPPLTLAGGIRREVVRAGTVILGGRPMGCPSRFCGCGASLHIFGRIIPSLNLAANWLRFPRTAPAPNMVAARRGHVFVLKSHIAGNTWLVHDSNSGGRRTRLHPRSIVGFAIVNPHGRIASL